VRCASSCALLCRAGFTVAFVVRRIVAGCQPCMYRRATHRRRMRRSCMTDRWGSRVPRARAPRQQQRRIGSPCCPLRIARDLRRVPVPPYPQEHSTHWVSPRLDRPRPPRLLLPHHAASHRPRPRRAAVPPSDRPAARSPAAADGVAAARRAAVDGAYGRHALRRAVGSGRPRGRGRARARWSATT